MNCPYCGYLSPEPKGAEFRRCSRCRKLLPVSLDAVLDEVAEVHLAYELDLWNYQFLDVSELPTNWRSLYVRGDDIIRLCNEIAADPQTARRLQNFLGKWAGIEKIDIDPLPGRGTYEFRLLNGVYFSGGNVSRALFTVITAIIFHGGITAIPGALGNFLRLDSRLRPRLLPVIKRLVGVQRDVFETVHLKTMEQVVVNFDALNKRRFGDAYGGAPGPTTAEVVHLLRKYYESEEVTSALSQLGSGGDQILSQDADETWHITF